MCYAYISYQWMTPHKRHSNEMTKNQEQVVTALAKFVSAAWTQVVQ